MAEISSARGKSYCEGGCKERSSQVRLKAARVAESQGSFACVHHDMGMKLGEMGLYSWQIVCVFRHRPAHDTCHQVPH